MIFVTLVVVLSLGGSLAASDQPCYPCYPKNCQAPLNCVAGEVKDKCRCCDVCGVADGELCDIPGVNSACGTNMTCRAVAGTFKCVCDHGYELCGSDGKTYRNICHMKEMVRRGDSGDVTVVGKGPCKRRPHLISGPLHTKNYTGGYVALSCEAEGIPIPTIDWFFTRVNGEVHHLPGDNGDMSVNMIGGPGRNQITGWLQIKDLLKYYEGDYTCMAHNEKGRVDSQARVLVRN